MGCERRVVYDFVNVLNNEANLNQALIKDKRTDNLFILPASQTRDKDALTLDGVQTILNELSETFEYIICDSPAGIEKGAQMALYYADRAIVVTNPEVSSVRDSDRILGILQSKSLRAETGGEQVKEHLLLTRYNPTRVADGEMLSVADVEEILAIPLLGVIPESEAVLKASNQGEPVIFNESADAGQAYSDAVDRLLGEQVAFRFLEAEKKGFDYFRNTKTNSASLAKERLQVIVAHERGQRTQPDYLPKMQQEIIDVIKKYITIDSDQVSVTLDNNDNVTLPDPGSHQH